MTNPSAIRIRPGVALAAAASAAVIVTAVGETRADVHPQASWTYVASAATTITPDAGAAQWAQSVSQLRALAARMRQHERPQLATELSDDLARRSAERADAPKDIEEWARAIAANVSDLSD